MTRAETDTFDFRHSKICSCERVRIVDKKSRLHSKVPTPLGEHSILWWQQGISFSQKHECINYCVNHSNLPIFSSIQTFSKLSGSFLFLQNWIAVEMWSSFFELLRVLFWKSNKNMTSYLNWKTEAWFKSATNTQAAHTISCAQAEHDNF